MAVRASAAENVARGTLLGVYIIEVAWRAISIAAVLGRQEKATVKAFMTCITTCRVHIGAHLTGIRKMLAFSAEIRCPINDKKTCVTLLHAKGLVIDLSCLDEQQVGDIGDGSVGIVDKVNLLGLVSGRREDSDK